jgi:hypothetical protein
MPLSTDSNGTVFGLLSVALLSFVGISTTDWWDPIVSSRWPRFSFRVTALVLWILTLAVGHRWLGRQFARFRHGPTPSLEFATEKDRRIAFWQKFGVITLCGLGAPWLGIAVNHFVK